MSVHGRVENDLGQAFLLLQLDGLETFTEAAVIGERFQPLQVLQIQNPLIADGFRTWEEICVGDFEQYCPADR